MDLIEGIPLCLYKYYSSHKMPSTQLYTVYVSVRRRSFETSICSIVLHNTHTVVLTVFVVFINAMEQSPF